MFTSEEIIRLSNFLGVEANVDYAKVKVNKTRNTVFDTEIDKKIRGFYADVYEFCYSKYPITEKLWVS